MEGACSEWGYPVPGEDYYGNVYSRLPVGLCELLNKGIEAGIIIQQGKQFLLEGLSLGKGEESLEWS